MEKSAYQVFKTNISKYRFKDLKMQKKICDELLKTSLKNNDNEGIFIASTYLLDHSISLRDDQNCQTYMYEALAHKDESYKEELSQLYQLCGIYSYMSFDIQNALNYYCQTLHLCNENKDLERKAGIYNNIALVFHSVEDYKEALHYYIEAYNLIVQNGHHEYQRNTSIILGNIVSCYVVLEDVKNVEFYFEKLKPFNVFPAMKDCIEANIFWLKGDGKRAKEYAKKALGVVEDAVIDQHLAYTIHEDIVELMLKIGSEKEIMHAIQALCNVSNPDSIDEKLRIQRYYIKFANAYNRHDLLPDLYCKYYQINEISESKKKIAQSSSYRNQILLDKMIKLNCNLQESATIDAVTNLKNRYAFEHDIKIFLENENIDMLSLIMCDVDDFKDYNDQHGHLFGDEVLRKIGNLLNAKIDHSIIPYRYGGDEFLCLAIDKTNEELESYITSVFEELKNTGSKIHISIGTYSCKRMDIHHQNDLVKHADKALYNAKHKGKNRYEFG